MRKELAHEIIVTDSAGRELDLPSPLPDMLEVRLGTPTEPYQPAPGEEVPRLLDVRQRRLYYGPHLQVRGADDVGDRVIEILSQLGGDL